MPSKLGLIIRVYFYLLGWTMRSIRVGAIMALRVLQRHSNNGIHICMERGLF